MKKFLSVLLAVALVACLCSTAFAASTDANSDDILTTNEFATAAGENSAKDDHVVTLNITNLHDTVQVYRVDITWADLDFTYSFGTGATWDPATHTYTSEADAGWTGNGTILVKNHSNREITVNAGFDDNGSAKSYTYDSTIVISIDTPADQVLESADIDGIYGEFDNGAEVTYTVSVAGAPSNKAAANDLEVTTVTVVLNDTDAAEMDIA